MKVRGRVCWVMQCWPVVYVTVQAGLGPNCWTQSGQCLKSRQLDRLRMVSEASCLTRFNKNAPGNSSTPILVDALGWAGFSDQTSARKCTSSCQIKEVYRTVTVADQCSSTIACSCISIADYCIGKNISDIPMKHSERDVLWIVLSMLPGTSVSASMLSRSRR